MKATLFHFLRPEWLLAIIPLLLFCFWLLNQVSRQSNWKKVVDPELLRYLLQKEEIKRQRRWPVFLLGLTGSLSIIALAGPTWERLPQPVFRDESALVLILDLSRSMDAQDVKPSRLERARFKIADILKQRSEGQTALIVYAADAFTVTPLTDDTRTIASQLSALTTDLMPAQGSNSHRAIELAVDLLKRASQTSGDILLITDEVEKAAGVESAQWLVKQGYRLSILGVGTKEGAPVPVQGGMLKDAQGNIVIPKLDSAGLDQIASSGGGLYVTISVDDSDIKKLALNDAAKKTDNTLQQDEQTTDSWREFGPWLLLPVLPLAALVFRRGVLLAMLLALLPIPEPVQAFEWQDLWKTPDQRAQKLMQQQQPDEAAKYFNHPAWKAGAYYRSGHYQDALKAYQAIEGTEARYNEGNTLAKLGRLEEAIKAYDKALKADPDHEDAKYNRQLIEELLKQQSQQSSQNSEQQSDQSSETEHDQEQQNSDESQQSSQSADENQASGSSPYQDEEQQAAEYDSKQDSADQNEMSQHSTDKKQQDQSPSDQNQQPDQRQEISQSESDQKKQGDEPGETVANDDQQQSEQQIANEQWLRRIPDDPAGLLRRKFKYQYSKRPKQYTGEKQW